MKAVFAVTVLAALASQLEAASSRVPADLVAALRATSDARCHSRTTSCKDCTTVNTCAYIGGGYTFLRASPCPDSKPYCDGGQCVKVSSADVCTASPPLAADFSCNGVRGYLPAPFDCTKFYVCAADDRAFVYNCPAQHVYDHARAGCVRLDENPDSCFSFDCAQNAQQYVLYAPDPSVYAYCVDGANALVSSCPADYQMNPLNGNEPCRPVCSRAGRIAHSDNGLAYYECFQLADDTLSEPQLYYCPPSMDFDRAGLRCKDEQAPSQPTPTPNPYFGPTDTSFPQP